jgi:hypothetical protein
MNSIEKELHGYINGTERMSGFDSYDEGDMSYFDGDSMSYFDNDDMSYASGPGASSMVSDPYVLSFTNTTTGTNNTAVLFGYNDYSTGYTQGQPAWPGIQVANLQGGTYGRLLTQSNNKPFKIGKFRFQAATYTSGTDNTSSQLAITITINHVDGNGKQYSTPLNLAIARDAYQQQNNILDVTKPITVDGNTYLTFTVYANTVLTIAMFPVEVFSTKAVLNGGKTLNMAQAPRLSAKNVAPVIIQTAQAVKGITG